MVGFGVVGGVVVEYGVVGDCVVGLGVVGGSGAGSGLTVPQEFSTVNDRFGHHVL